MTFQHEKTNRLNTINDFGPSPAFYDTTTGMSMCSSQENLRSKISLHKSNENERSQSSINSASSNFNIMKSVDDKAIIGNF